MSQPDVLKELRNLPVEERLEVIEAALREIRDVQRTQRQAKRAEMKKRLAEAAEIAAPYYETDEELTAFTALDGEDFCDYEKE